MAGLELNPLEREFLDASRELHEREVREAQARARRLRILAIAASTLAVVALVVGGLAALQWRSANDARDEAKAATGEALVQRDVAEAERKRSDEAVIEASLARLETEIPLLLNTDRALAFALAAEARNLQPGPRTDALLNLVLGHDPRYLGRIFPSEPTLSGYDLSADGKYIAMRTNGGLFELYDANTRALVTSIQAEPTRVAGGLLFLPGGKAIVSGAYDPARRHFTVVVREAPTLAEQRRFEFPPVSTRRARTSRDNVAPAATRRG